MKNFIIITLALLLVGNAGKSRAQAPKAPAAKTAKSKTEKEKTPQTKKKGAPALKSKGKGAFSSPAENKKNLVMDGLFQKQIITTRKPIPYPYIREADVIWSKRIWRVIDLREKINHPLYYPTVEMTLRKSLIQTLVTSVRAGAIRAFDPDEDDEFTTMITPEGLSKRFDAVDRSERRKKMDGTGDTTILIRGSYNWEEVREILVKEDWFFDKHYSKMFVRIVGICPIRVYKKVLNVAGGGDDDDGEEQKKQLFWIQYDDARDVLASTPAYMPNNDATVLSYDDLFNDRKFTSYIQKESNPHNNRSIATYTTDGYAALLESEKVKTNIINWEHDLWEY